MAVIANSTTLDTEFTPAAGVFRVQVNVAPAVLKSRASGATLFAIEVILGRDETRLVDNDVAGTVYKWGRAGPSEGQLPRADQ